MDYKGTLNLPQTAFRVFEDDRPQDITFFSSGDVPVAVGLVLDNSGSMIARRGMVTAGTNAFAESSHPEDELFTDVFNENVRYGLPDGVDFTKSGQQITVRDLVMKGSGTSGSGTPSSSGTAGAGETVTLRVEGKAAARLASFKAGDSIEVECRQAGSTSGSTGTGSTGTSGSTGSTTGSGMTGSGQAMADAHCASVTDIGKGKSSR